MDRKQAIDDIKARWRELYPADKKGGIICPICGSGEGPNGSGISEWARGRNHFLRCWNGGCKFERGGSVIDLFMLEHGKNPDDPRDLAEAVDELAGILHITIDPYTGAHRRSTAAEDFADLDAPTEAAAAPRAGAGLSFSGIVAPAAQAATAPAQAATAPAQATTQPRPDYTEYLRKCVTNLAESEAARDYLQRRGISLDTAAAFGVGFDPAWISPTVIRNQQAKGNSWRPAPKPCIIIPSTTAHYVARDIRPDLDDQQRKFAKMNEGSPEIMGLSVLYGEDSRYLSVFVTEGAFDALSIAEIGVPAIALNSTSNVDKLLKQLEQQPTEATLILCLDNDEAGKQATARLKEGLNRLNISWTTADVTGGHKDPNEALTADRAAFERAVIKAIEGEAAKPDNTLTYLDELMAGEIEKFKQARDRKTGFVNLDEKAGALYSGLYVLAAISSLGKTTLALQMADQIAAAGHDVLFFSMEQSRLEMVSKSLARLTAQADFKNAVTSLSIRKGYLPPQVHDAINAYRAQTGDRLSIIEGNFNCDIGYISDYIRRYQQRTGTAPVVFIDYLQVLQPAAEGKSKGSKKDEIDIAITELKRLSRELDLTIIVISSLNRTNYLTPIAFESLKESGSIEYTADVVWGLQLACLGDDLFMQDKKITEKRERVNLAKAENPRRIKLVCLKNRYGISSYDCNFEYYPQYDLFIPSQTTGSSNGKGAKRI